MLTRVAPYEVNASDLDYLLEADSVHPKSVKLSPQETVIGIWGGRFQLWRCEGDVGVLLTEVTEHNGERRLLVVRIAGKGLGTKSSQLVKCMQHAAKELHCVAVETVVYLPTLAKALMRAGCQHEATQLVIGVD